MSFSVDVKKETASLTLEDSMARAQLAAMVQASVKEETIDLHGDFRVGFAHVFLAKRYVQLIKQLYGVECKIDYESKARLTKTSTTTITISDMVKNILEDLGVLKANELQTKVPRSMIVKDKDARSYLAGWFLIKGSINSPQTSNYHAEIRFEEMENAQYVQGLLTRFFVDAKITQRRKEYVLYLKAAEKIADMLRLIGAHQALLMFEDIRINRDFHNSLTRLDNCEVSNEMKSIQAGQEQVMAIEKLIKYKRLDYMEQRLQVVAQLRLEHPEHSLKELAYEYQVRSGESISKSGIKHRLDKLLDAASRIND